MKRSQFVALASSALVLPAVDVSTSALDDYMAPHVAMAEFRGVVAIAPHGVLQRVASYGGAFNETTRFRVASVAKSFTAATADALIEMGALSLQTSLGTLLQPFARSGITIDHLLNHSSGIPDIYTLPEFAAGHRNPISRDDYISLLAGKKPDFTPGTKGSYSNSGYSLLAFAIETAAGASFADVQRKHVLDPLELQGTDVLPGTNVLTGADPGAPNQTRIAEPLDPSWLIGNGSLYSSARDLLHWMAAVRDGKVRTLSWPYPWGWGQDKTKTTLEGDGRYAGYACRIQLNIKTGDAVVVLSAIQSAVVNEITNDLMGGIGGAALVPVKLRKAMPLTAGQATEYAGKYRLSESFILTVQSFGETIQVASADGVFEALDPLGNDNFFFRILNSDLAFRRSVDGHVVAIDWGPGAFTLQRFA